ncbi:MAG TPA: hypothetical protein VD883_00485 [Candidatus Omnitrophota bacterium]|nr:hypothetical protein [Candidatus Omnitrophota bacterium]
MRRSQLVLGILGIVFLLSAGPVFAATIQIDSPKIELTLAPGEAYSGEIVADNPTDQELKLNIYLQDWVYLPNMSGEKKFDAIGSLPFSASKWITFNPAEAVVPPFGKMTVRYTVQVPQDATGGNYSVLFFETILGTTVDEEGANVIVAGRIGSLFLLQVRGTIDRRGELESVEVTPPIENKPMEITTRFKNSGNTHIILAGNFLIMDSEGKVHGRGDLRKLYMLSGDSGEGTTQWVGRLEKGVYQVLLTYDLGESQTLVEEKSITIE